MFCTRSDNISEVVWKWFPISLIYLNNGLYIRSTGSSILLSWMAHTACCHLVVWRVISSHAGAEHKRFLTTIWSLNGEFEWSLLARTQATWDEQQSAFASSLMLVWCVWAHSGTIPHSNQSFPSYTPSPNHCPRYLYWDFEAWVRIRHQYLMTHAIEVIIEQSVIYCNCESNERRGQEGTRQLLSLPPKFQKSTWQASECWRVWRGETLPGWFIFARGWERLNPIEEINFSLVISLFSAQPMEHLLPSNTDLDKNYHGNGRSFEAFLSALRQSPIS